MKPVFWVILLLAAVSVSAQVDTRVKAPETPAATPTSKDADDSSSSTTEQSQERLPALSGLEVLRSDLGRDELSISGQVSEFADSHARHIGQASGFGAVSQFGALMQLRHTWGRAVAIAEYSGGFAEGSRGSSEVQNYHEAGFTQTFTGGRWRFLGGAHFTYLPESGFGFNAFRAVPDANAALDPHVQPAQTVFTRSLTQFNETFATEVEYGLNRLSSITMFGTYGRRVFDGTIPLNSPTLLNSTETGAAFGYNHIVNSRNSIAVSYAYGQFDFDRAAGQLRTHSAQFFYARRLNRKLNYKLSAGPQLRMFQTIAKSSVDVIMAGSAELEYQMGRTQLDLAYLRQTTGGSGVLAGSLVNQVAMNAGRQLGRLWRGSASISYARTASLDGLTLFAGQAYDAVYATGRVDRHLTRTLDVFLSYGVQVQSSQTHVSGAGALFPTRHLIVTGLVVHPRPLLLRR